MNAFRFVISLYLLFQALLTVSAPVSTDKSALIYPAVAFDEPILKTFPVKLDELEPICIDGSVQLTCSPEYLDRDILEYTWTDLSTGIVVDKQRTILVSPRVTTTYELKIKYILREKELILNGDFEKGRQDFATDYRFESWNTASDALWNEGKYKIATRGDRYHSHFWATPDHTSGSGNMMVVNGHPGKKVIVWQEQIRNIEIGRDYAFSAWGASLTDGKDHWGVANCLPIWQFSINSALFGNDFTVEHKQWDQFFSIWKATATTATISLVDKVTATGGNDFALDDISFAPVEEGVGTVEVRVLPQVDLNALADLKVCEGENLKVVANAVGSGNLKYEWKKGSALISKESFMPIHEAKLTEAGSYTCTVTGTCGSKTQPFDLAVREKLRNGGAEVDRVVVCKGQSVMLSAKRCTGYNLTYRWSGPNKWSFGNGWLPTVGDKATYSKGAVGSLDVGKYNCIVKAGDGCGVDTVYSVLRLEEALKVESVGDTTVCVGTTVKLYVTANLKNGTVKWTLPDGTIREIDTLVVANVQSLQAGVYRYEVVGMCEPPVSGDIQLKVHPVMGDVTVSPRDTSVCENSMVIFQASARGDGMSYKWTGPAGFTAHTANMTINEATAQNAGTYTVTATDQCGREKKNWAKLTLRNEYDGLKITSDTTVCPGENTLLQVSGGKNGLNYKWSREGKDLVAGPKLLLEKVTTGKTGLYICKISGVCSPQERSVNVGVYESFDPQGNEGLVRKCIGESVTFSVKPQTSVVRYEWKKNGVTMDGNISNALLLNNITAEDAAQYQCVVISKCGEETLSYELQLKEQTKIVSFTQDQYINENGSVTLFVNAVGEPPLNYKWYKNDIEIGGNSNKLFIDNIGKSATHRFTCKVTGGCGVVDVPSRTVTVGKYDVLTENTSVNLCEGGTFSYTAVTRPASCPEGAPLSYRWKFNGALASSNSVLKIDNLSTDKIGQYICDITGTCGSATLTLDVKMIDKPRFTTLFPDAIRSCEGDNVKITTQVGGNDLYTYEWRRRGELLSGTDTERVIKNISLSDSGGYSCKVTGKCGETSDSLKLIVREALKITEKPGTLPACSGKAVEFKVIATGHDLTYLWSGPNGNKWAGEKSAVYTNPSVSLGDNGTYRCILNSTCKSDTVFGVLEVEKKLGVDVSSDKTVCLGSNQELYIHANLKNVACHWTLPDGTSRADSVLKLNGVLVADAGVYKYSVKSRCSTFGPGEVRLHIYKTMGPLVVSPLDTAVCEKEMVTFVASATGDGLKYHWMGPRRFISTESSITISDIDSLKAGRYEVSVTDVCGLSQPGAVNLSLLKEFDRVVASRDTTVCVGSDLAFRVMGGVAGMSYEWKFREKVVGNDAVLPLENIKESDAGEYVCRIIGTCDTVTRKVILGVHRLLTAEQPNKQFRPCPRETVEFAAVADGVNVSYIWSKEGKEVGYRDSLYRIEHVIPSDIGFYQCHIGSACGTQEFTYELQIGTETMIKSYTPDKFVTVGDSTKLFVRTVGDHNVFQWWQDGVSVVAQNELLFVPNVGGVDTLHFMCVVKGDCGADTAWINIKVGPFKPVREVASPDTLCEESTYTYIADRLPEGCYGDESFDYQWMYKGKKLSQTPLLRLEEVTLADSGKYTCYVKASCGEINISWDVKILRLPEIDAITPSAYIVEGDVHKIEVTASGDNLSYTWTKSPLSPVVGSSKEYATETTQFEFDPVKYEDRGRYEVTVRNVCSSVSDHSDLDVWQKTTIISPLLQDVAVCRGSDTTFTVKALGSVGLVYRWYRNDTLLSVPMVNHLVLKNVQPGQGGKYMCVVSGRGGEDTCIINLTVNLLPEFTLDGKFTVCLDERGLIQLYEGNSVDPRLDYSWKVTGGAFVWKEDRSAMVAWEGADGVITLGARSLNTQCYVEKSEKINYIPLLEIYLDMPVIVGYCLDSLALNHAYPSGGYYLVNGFETGQVRFENKAEIYQVGYYFTDTVTTCSAQKEDRIAIDIEPFIQLKEEQIVTGLCRPVSLEVERASAGSLVWSGAGKLEIADVLKPLYVPDPMDGSGLFFNVELTDQYDCKAVDFIAVEVAPLPEALVTTDITVGMCTPVTLKGEYITAWFDKMEWFPADQLKIVDDYNAEVTERIAGENTWWIVVSDVFGCQGSDTVQIRVMPSPPLGNEEFCENDPLEIDCSSYHGYIWSDGYAGMHRVLDKKGDYTLRITDEFDCVGDVFYDVHPIPSVHLSDTVIFTEQTMLFELHLDDRYAPYDIVWQDGAGGRSREVGEEGYYGVQVTDNLGCMAADTVFLKVKQRYIAAPNAFLPESNSGNSKFYLKEVNFVSNFEMFIYNRWGELMFKTKEIGFNGGWDGSFKGSACLPGAYVWVAFSDGKEVGRGTVMLVK